GSRGRCVISTGAVGGASRHCAAASPIAANRIGRKTLAMGPPCVRLSSIAAGLAFTLAAPQGSKPTCPLGNDGGAAGDPSLYCIDLVPVPDLLPRAAFPIPPRLAPIPLIWPGPRPRCSIRRYAPGER